MVLFIKGTQIDFHFISIVLLMPDPFMGMECILIKLGRLLLANGTKINYY